MGSLLNTIKESLFQSWAIDTHINQPLAINGDPTGTINLKIDGSLTPQKFYIQPPEGTKYILKRMNSLAIATTFTNAEQYAGITLTNGIKVYTENDSGVIVDYTQHVPLKSTFDWALLAGVDASSQDGAQSDPFTVRWTFSKGYGNIILHGSLNERLVVEVNDNMTGASFIRQYCVVQGRKVRE